MPDYAWYDPRGWFRQQSISLDEWAQMMSFAGSMYQLGFPSTTMSTEREAIDNNFAGYVRGAYESNGVVFALMLVRMLLFSEARLTFQNMRGGRPGDLFGTQELAILETPWPGGTTGDLMARAIQDVDLAGNHYATIRGGRVWRLRPDWVTIIVGNRDSGAGPDDWDLAELAGYAYTPGGPGSGRKPIMLLPEEVAHFAPLPDPLATYRGMSWISPILRELLADRAMTGHRLKFFEQGATPNMVVTLDASIQQEAFKTWVKLLSEKSEGLENAYRTLYLGGGATAEVVGANMRQLDFKQVQGAGETRMAAAAGVPPIIAGFSEGLASATYSNYSQARRRFSDGTMRPLWRNYAGSMAKLIRVPSSSRLWYDDRDIPFVKEDQKDAAEILMTQAQTIKALVEAGYLPEDVVKAVSAGDLSRLSHSGLYSVQLRPAGAEDNNAQPALPAPSSNGQPAVPAGVDTGGS